MGAVTLSWQRLDEPGFEQVSLELGRGLALTACGSLRHDDSDTRLNYRMSTNREGWISRVQIDVESPAKTRLAVHRLSDGRWLIDGAERPEFDQCSELDLQCGALTNAFAIRRLALEKGQCREMGVLFVRLPELSLEICPQSYSRLPDLDGRACYLYRSPGYSAEITVDAQGFTEHYSGFLRRITN
jgi:hypothetical protein